MHAFYMHQLPNHGSMDDIRAWVGASIATSLWAANASKTTTNGLGGLVGVGNKARDAIIGSTTDGGIVTLLSASTFMNRSLSRPRVVDHESMVVRWQRHEEPWGKVRPLQPQRWRNHT
jgi:hypothetical protein